MFASIQDLEFVQGQSRDVPDRELGPNINIRLQIFVFLIPPNLKYMESV